MIDAYSKYLALAPVQTKEMHEVVQAFFTTWICTFGPCDTLVSDNGKEFKNALFTTLQKSYGITQRFTTPYHPQANGMAERAVQMVLNYIRKYVAENGFIHFLLCNMLTIPQQEGRRIIPRMKLCLGDVQKHLAHYQLRLNILTTQFWLCTTICLLNKQIFRLQTKNTILL